MLEITVVAPTTGGPVTVVHVMAANAAPAFCAQVIAQGAISVAVVPA